MSSQFGFLEAEFPEQFEAAVRAERYALEDPGYVDYSCSAGVGVGGEVGVSVSTGRCRSRMRTS